MKLQDTAPVPAGMVDVPGLIAQASQRVAIDQLVAQGRKFVSLLSKERMNELINQAVRTILDKHRAAAGSPGVPLELVEAESKAEFNELVHEFQESAKARTRLEEGRQALDDEMTELRRELGDQKALAERKAAQEARQDPLKALHEVKSELDRLVVNVFEKRRLILGATGTPEAIGELAEIEELIRGIVARVVDGGSRRPAADEGQARTIELLQRRIEKLYAQILAMEEALRAISTSKVYSNQQVQNLLRQLGLLEDDRFLEKKREMLKVVFDGNTELRRRSRELEEKGYTLSSPDGLDGTAGHPGQQSSAVAMCVETDPRRIS